MQKLLLLTCVVSFLFSGISDEIEKDKTLPSEIKEINKFIDTLNLECKKVNYITNYYRREEISIQELENFYQSVPTVNENIEKINQQYEERIVKFYNAYNEKSFKKIYEKLTLGIRNGDDHWHDYNYVQKNLKISELCPKIDNIDEYKTDIKNAYLEATLSQEKTKNQAEIERIKKDKLWNIFKRLATTIEQYDVYLADAHRLFEKLRQLSMPEIYSYNQDEENSYINELKYYRQQKIESIEVQKKNKQQQKEFTEAKKASIPKYKNWKNITVPKFQKSLKAGDSVAGGIVWKVDGNLVVVDTGNRGLVSQRQDQTYPRVPQDLMPLFMDEITGVTRY
jgi:hypothetical protein